MSMLLQLGGGERIVEESGGDTLSVAGCSISFLADGAAPQVRAVDSHCPAALQGVKEKDSLTAIDGRDTRDMTHSEAATLLRTASRLEFQRAGAPNGGGAQGMAVSKAATAALAGPPPPGAGAGQGEEMLVDDAMAAMSPKAPAPLAAALGFFQAAAALGPAEDSLAELQGDGSYQKAPVALSSLANLFAGKGPFDKGGGGKGKGPGKGKPPTFSLPAGPPPPAAVPPPAKGGGGGGWGPMAGGKGGWGQPRVVLPPALTGEAAAPSADPGAQPESLPADTDKDAWMELLRDGFAQQLRGENEWPEPPPFHRALHFASPPGEKVSEGKYPREALNMQLQLLFKTRAVGAPDVADAGVATVVPPPTPPPPATYGGYGDGGSHGGYGDGGSYGGYGDGGSRWW